MESTAQLVQVIQNPLATPSEVESAAEKLCKALSRLGFSKLGPIVADARQACTVISQTSIPGPTKDAVDKLLRCLPPSSTKRKLGGPDVVDCRKLDGPIECATWSAFRDNRVDTDVMELDDFSDENAVGIATTAIEAHRSPQVMVLNDDITDFANNTSIETCLDHALLPPDLDSMDCAGLDSSLMLLENKVEASPGGGRSKWRPGHDVKSFFGMGRGVGTGLQAQVLLCNGYIRISSLTCDKQKLLRAIFSPVGSCIGTSLAAQALSGILRVPAKTIEHIVKHVKRHDWVPTLPESTVRRSASAKKKVDEDKSDAFVNLLRTTQFISTHGLSKSMLPNICYLIMSAKGDVGHSNHSRRFCTIAETRADNLLLHATRQFLSRPLGATGVMPDVAVIADSGTVGKYYSQARDTVKLVGMIAPTADAPFMAAVLVACIVECADGRKQAVPP